MTAKTSYEVGETVWIAGVSRNNARLTKGKIIKVLDLSTEGFTAGPHYIVEIPTHIESLLEIRTWGTISEDERGPVGSLRNLGVGIDATIRFVNHTGFEAHDDQMPDDPTPEQIHAAIEESLKNSTHAPLTVKEVKPKRRFNNRKRKQ
jgi:hypothetical protein